MQKEKQERQRHKNTNSEILMPDIYKYYIDKSLSNMPQLL